MSKFSYKNITVADYMSFVLTHKCNRNCGFCIDLNRNKIDGELSLENVKKFCNFAAENNIKDILLVGGEPILHSKLFEVLEIIRSYDRFKIILTSNFDNLEPIYEIERRKLVDAFNFSNYGQKTLPDPKQFKHATITISTLLFKHGQIRSKEQLDEFIDKYQNDYDLKFSTLVNHNKFTQKNYRVDWLDELEFDEEYVAFDEILTQVYRGFDIKRYDIVVNESAEQSYKGLIDGTIAQHW